MKIVWDIAAVTISLLAASFTAWQAYEARQARIDARDSQIEARQDFDRTQKLQRELAENGVRESKRSADAAESSAAALLATTRTLAATSQLDLEPNIGVEARFQPSVNLIVAPGIILWNTGRADAIAITVLLKRWIASPAISGGDTYQFASISDVIPNWRISRIAAGATHVLQIDAQATEESSLLIGRNVRQPFIELAIHYLRPTDRKSYEKRAYYFVGQDHRWVAENNPRSNTEINQRIKSRLQKEPLWLWDNYQSNLDLTHEVKRPTSRKR